MDNWDSLPATLVTPIRTESCRSPMSGITLDPPPEPPPYDLRGPVAAGVLLSPKKSALEIPEDPSKREMLDLVAN